MTSENSALPESKRRRLERACCLTLALRDLLQPEIAAVVGPLGAIIAPASDDLEFGCPLQANDLDSEKMERIGSAQRLISALLAVCKANTRYAPAELVLREIAEDLSDLGE